MSNSLESSIVRICGTDGVIVGAGFLVRERYILTCAHVVSQALDLADSPVDPPPGVVSLDFPRIPPHTLLTAKVILWYPPLSDGSGDLAGLELEREPPTRAERVRFASAEDVWKHDFSALGFPEDYVEGVWATGRLLRRQATNWIQIEDVKAQGFAVGPGFSGTPVWDEQLQGVVGMVVAASRPADTRTAFVIPLEVLASAWPLLTIPQDQPRNPYKGLHPFTQRDAADFFGREAVVEKGVELVNSLMPEHPASSSTRLLTILGPSGVGKSSLVMAGLLPKLQQGALPGSKEWVYLDPIVPGKHPLEALASTLKPHFPDTSFKTLLQDLEDDAARGLHLLATQLAKHRGTSVVLLIDQFEELFVQTESEDERQRFIHLLLTACSEPRGPLLALLTLRADFYDRPMQYPELFHLIESHHFSLLAIEPDDLRRVVEQPAALSDVQVTFEGDLVNRLLFEVQGQVGALPLLQFTLDQLFQRRSGRQLTLSAYRDLGGVKGALAKQAEETYAALPSQEHRKLARALFVRLIAPGATEQDTTRRRAGFSEFMLDDATQTRLLRETIDAFIAARLLTTNEVAGTTTIEVSHEAVIREWKRLAEWILEAREDIYLQQDISKDIAEWKRRGKPKDRLYRGSQLEEAKVWAARNLPSKNEMDFLQSCIAEHDREGVERRKRQRSLQVAVVTIGLLLVIGLILTWVFNWQLQAKNQDLLRSLPVNVTNCNDHGPGSLRQALRDTEQNNTITFIKNLKCTIVLTSGELVVNKNIVISGPGTNILSISGGYSNRVFAILKGSAVIISNLSIINGQADNAYGALNYSSGVFSSKKSDYTFGGNIYNAGSLALINCRISNGTADFGGGIANIGTLSSEKSLVSNNITSMDGGGIYNDWQAVLSITNSTISNNQAGINGGGIANDSIVGMTLLDSTIANNSAVVDGGGIWSFANTISRASTISNNVARRDGGGIFAFGTLNFYYSTLSSNDAGRDGGGIFTRSGDAEILYSTIFNNKSKTGGGVGNVGADPVTLQYSIIAGNHANQSRDVQGKFFLPVSDLIQNLSSAQLNFADDKVRQHSIFGESPEVGPLQNNGGPTQTHALLPGSPAIDKIPGSAGDPFGLCGGQNVITVDQRGVARPQGSGCDFGAFEYVTSP
jgi:Trypsin-like peptidase domain